MRVSNPPRKKTDMTTVARQFVCQPLGNAARVIVFGRTEACGR